MKQQNFSVTKRLGSFRHAFNGLRIMIREEHNSRIHILATLVVVIAGFALKITPFEWLVVILAIGFVITTELVNSAIENLSDFVSPEKQDMIKKVKDLSAAAVLICAIVALVVGVVVFLPKIIHH